MKRIISFLSMFILLPGLIFCQDFNAKRFTGSWMGRVATKDFSLKLILRFEAKDNNIRGLIDSPDEEKKGIPFDKVNTVRDSIWGDDFFKGVLLPGDSVINGLWGGSIEFRLSRTNYVYTLKTNLNPKVDGYRIIKLIETTPIKDQQGTGTCWSYATTSFIETEAVRLGKDPVILSPMFYVIPTYVDKAEKYIRMKGTSWFNEGDLTFSVMSAYKKYGAIPEKIFSGNTDSVSMHYHYDMNKALLKKVRNYVQSGRGNMTTEGYRKEIQELLFNTIGKAPETFTYKNKRYTPNVFANEMIGINPDDYVEITSYSHHPFYSKFILEIEGNWNNNYYLNLPMNDFMHTIDSALLHNYSVCWDGDIYQGYNDGFAILNDSINNITQEVRQAAFDNLTTQDVHNMHIVGLAENTAGKRYYIVKNSSDARNCGGYLYMSREFLLLKTISVMVHKSAIPKDIRSKLPDNLL